MTPFTDDKFQNLKRQVATRKQVVGDGQFHSKDVQVDLDVIDGVIARLEASEAMEPYWKYYDPISPVDEKDYNERMEAHRKASGRG